MCLHLPGVLGIEVENLLSGRGVESTIFLDVIVQTGQIIEAKFVSQHQHLGLGFGNLLEAELVNLLWGQIGCSEAPYLEAVTRVAIGKSPHPRLRTAMGSVVIAHKLSEAFVCGQNLGVDGC